jgi:hypothetical protein
MTMAIWLDVSVIEGMWGTSDKPMLSNSNDLRNGWKAVVRKGT